MFTMSGDETAGAILVLVTVKASIVHKQLRTKPFGRQVHLYKVHVAEEVGGGVCCM